MSSNVLKERFEVFFLHMLNEMWSDSGGPLNPVWSAQEVEFEHSAGNFDFVGVLPLGPS